MPSTPRQELVDSPQEQAHVQYVQPVNPVQYERDQQFRVRASTRRDPQARLNAQATLDAAPRINVILNPTEADREYAKSHIRRLPDGTEEPIYPKWNCTYNGIQLAYDVGVPIEMPVYIWEQYRHNQQLPVFRQAPGTAGRTFEVAEGQTPEFGR